MLRIIFISIVKRRTNGARERESNEIPYVISVPCLLLRYADKGAPLLILFKIYVRFYLVFVLFRTLLFRLINSVPEIAEYRRQHEDK